MDSLADYSGATRTLLGTVLRTSRHTHGWGDIDCPTYDTHYDDPCSCPYKDTTHLDAVIAVWVDGRPVNTKPSESTFHLCVWEFPPNYTLRWWESDGEYSMLWDRPFKYQITIAATVDPRDQEFSYREIIKPYLTDGKLKGFELSGATFRAPGPRDKYLAQLEGQLSHLLTGTERKQDPENSHVAPRKKK